MSDANVQQLRIGSGIHTDEINVIVTTNNISSSHSGGDMKDRNIKEKSLSSDPLKRQRCSSLKKIGYEE